MAIIYRRLQAADLLRIGDINSDAFTETFAHAFYCKYISSWPDLCVVAEASDGHIVGYIIGKVEGVENLWHGHVTALSIMPEFRGCGLGKSLMNYLEQVCTEVYKCKFIDLYVRQSNFNAVTFYRKLGYITWKTQYGYYSDSEHALDMRKATSHDLERRCLMDAEEQLS